jgi:hypothetical protein
MKKLLFLLFLSIGLMAQSSWDIDYPGRLNNYGQTVPNSDSLQIAIGDSISGIYYLYGQLAMIAVDSNWTASGISFLIYNDLEGTWEFLRDTNGTTLIEYAVGIGKVVICDPNKIIGLKKIKFAKTTSGAYVPQSSAIGKLIITTINK